MQKKPKAKTTLTKFLAKIRDNPKALARLKSDPVSVLSKSGLTKAHQKILLSGDSKKIKLALKTAESILIVLALAGRGPKKIKQALKQQTGFGKAPDERILLVLSKG